MTRRVTLAFLAIAAVCLAGPDTGRCQTPAAREKSRTDDEGSRIPDAVAVKLQKLFANWLREWQRVDAGVTLDRFRLGGRVSWSFTPQHEFDPTSDWAVRTSSLRLRAPDSLYAVNPWMTCEISEKGFGFEPDVSVALFDLRSQRWGSIMGCGTPCLYDDAGWIGDRIVVVAQQTEYYPQDGPLFPDTVVIVPGFAVFDLAESTLTSYSGPAVPAAKVADSEVRDYAMRRIGELLGR